MKTLITAIGILCILGSGCAASRSAMAAKSMSAAADLDGDGHKENISVTSVPDVNPDRGVRFILRVGKAEARIDGDSLEGLAIVDIDRADKYKEIDVKTGTAGIDPITHNIYWYDGKTIHEVGRLTGGVDIKGNRIVLHHWFNCYVGITDKYVLDKKTRTLVLVPQEMYYIGLQRKVLQSFPVYYSRQSKSVVANVEKNSTITILAYVPNAPDPKDPGKVDVMGEWFLIKTQSGLLGWAQLETISQRVEGMAGAG